MFKEKSLVSFEQLLVGLSFFMPLVVLPSSFIFPFIVPKILLFRSIVLIMLAAYGLLLYINWDKYRPRVTALNLAVLGFWLSFALSTYVGVDWYRSFWDNHERMLGLFTVTHYVLFYYIVVAVITDKSQWHTLIRWFLGAGSLVMLIALLQKVDPELLLNRGSSRVSASLGNPIYVSGYGLFLLFFSLISYITTPKVEQSWRYAAMGSAVLGFLGIFLGGTRGTFLGLITAITILIISFGIFTQEKKYRLGVVGLFVLGIVAAMGAWVARDSAVVQSITPVARLVNINFAEIGNNTRVMAWGIAWESFVEKPVFGWGPNNYYYAFNEYYRPEFLRYGYGETWFDNAHNIVMNTLSTQGAFGIVTYLAIFAVVALMLLRARKREDIGNIEFAVLLAFFVGHFVHNVFVFENPTSYLYFFFALGYVAIRTNRHDIAAVSTKTVSTPALVVSGVLLLFALYTFNINPANANTATLRAIQALYQGGGVQEFALASDTPTPHIDDVRNDFARTVSQVVPQLVEAGRQEHALELLEIATREVEKNLALHPMDIRVHLMVSQLYQQRAALEQNPTYMVQAIQTLEAAREYSPERQQLLFTLGNMYAMTRNTTTAEGLFVEARDVAPVVGESWVQLVRYYQGVGNVSSSQQIANTALSASPTVRFRGGNREFIMTVATQ
jgi:O-antigen ligase